MGKSCKPILIICLFVIPAFAVAQNPCNDRLQQAKVLFESGQIEEIPTLLDSCITSGFTRQQEIQAYQLLIQTYLFDYNREKAKETMLRYLTKYPDYEFSNNDPVEFKEIYDLFTVKPNWGLGIYAGSNISQPLSNEIYSVYNQNSINSGYKSKIGFSIGVSAEKYLNKNFCLTLGLNYKNTNYQNIESTNNSIEKTVFNENASFLSIPVSVSAILGNKKILPFLFIGTEINYLLQANGNVNYSLLHGNSDIISESATITMNPARNPIEISAFSGIGLRYKIPHGYFKLWMGYNYSISNYINHQNRFQALDAVIKYRHIDDDFQLNQIYAGVSYSWILYKIKPK